MPLGAELRFVDRTRVVHRGRTCLFFGGTDYHRLGSHPEVLRAFREAAGTEGLDCAGSRITTGNHPLLGRLEREAGAFLGGREAVLTSGGYLSNTVALEAVRADYQRFFLAEGAHASLASPAEALPRNRVHVFRRDDPDGLARLLRLRLRPGERPLVLTDGVLAGDGRLPPLAAYWEAVRDLGGRLLVDDSHGMGVLGRTGQGSPEEAGLPPEAFLHTGTLSKGFGVFGGLVADLPRPGGPGFLELVAARSRAFVGATPVPPPVAAAGLRAVQVLRDHPELVTGLRALALSTRARLAGLGFPGPDSPAPIFSITYRNEARNRRLGAMLEQRGIYPTFIDYPGSPPGGHFRFSLSSAHTQDEVDQLVEAIAESRE
jgi:7-keto-8-aminopelargonate synthetase-like enzyme